MGGSAGAGLLDLLSDGGSLVSYAAATGQPIPVSELTLIVKRATVRGFFLGHYDYAMKVLPVIREAAPLVASGALFVPVAAVFDLENIHAAIQQLERGGKILLKVAPS